MTCVSLTSFPCYNSRTRIGCSQDVMFFRFCTSWHFDIHGERNSFLFAWLEIYTARTITKFSCIIWVHFIKRMLSENLWSFRHCYSALFAMLNLYAFVKHFFITCLNSSMLLCSRLWKWFFELLELLAFIAFLFTFAIFSSYLVFISAYSLNKKWNSPL